MRLSPGHIPLAASLSVLLAGCGTPGVRPRGGADNDAGEPAEPDDAERREEDAGSNDRPEDAGRVITPNDAGHVGCPPFQSSDHNGCMRLRSGPVTETCHPGRRAPLWEGLSVDRLDEVAPIKGVTGQRSASQRRLVVRGEVTELRPGRITVTGEDVEISLDPGMADGDVLPVGVGDVIEVAYATFEKRHSRRSTGELLRTDVSLFLHISDADGALLYALGDPFLPPRPASDMLEALGVNIEPVDDPFCGYADIRSMATEVGQCLIYVRNAAYELFGGAGDDRATVLPSNLGEFEVGGRRYSVESGDTYKVDDSHDDCNVPPHTDLRIRWIG